MIKEKQTLNADELPDQQLGLDPDMFQKAKEGDSFSQLDLGKAYYAATNLKDNSRKAFYWFMQSAQQRNMEAQFRLADLYAFGDGVEKDEFTAYDWYLKAALQGYPKALTRLHNIYHSENSMYCRGLQNDEEKKWDTAEFRAKNNIREMYEYRIQRMTSQMTRIQEYFKNLLAHFREINAQDKEGNREACLVLGFLYQHGYCVKKISFRAIEHYLVAAKKEDVDAQYNLACLYQENYDLKWNHYNAFRWYTIASKNDNCSAQHGLALSYLKGLGTDVNYSKAVYWFTQAAEKRNIKAQIYLACIYRKGEIVNQDHEKATYWYKKAEAEGSKVAQSCQELLQQTMFPIAKNQSHSKGTLAPVIYSRRGLCSRLRSDISRMDQSSYLEKIKTLATRAFRTDATAMLEIGLNYYHGDNFKKDQDIGFKWIRNAAKAGSLRAQHWIADIYLSDGPVEQNYYTTSIWYKKAAKKGDHLAQRFLGNMYYTGDGVRKDPLESSKWYTFSANKNNADAQISLGLLRQHGEGLRQNILEAVDWYNASARQKNPDAIFFLAQMQESGLGMKFNIEQVYYLYKKSASLGSISAQKILALLYSKEDNTKYDLKSSFRYWKMAADNGDIEAKYQIALMYMEGNGTEQDLIQAYNLFKELKNLKFDKALHVFSVPMGYSQTNDIDYQRVALMFSTISRKGIDSLEYNLGYHYQFNIEFECNHSIRTYKSNSLISKYWLEIASKKGVPEAQYMLASIYENTGWSVLKHFQVKKYYQRAHDNGNLDATCKFAWMYLYGRIVSQDFQKAFRLFNMASDLGHKEAYNVLNVADEYAKSEHFLVIKKMLELAGNSGSTISQYKLGCLALNRGSPEYSIPEAVKWLKMASDGGLLIASYKLGLLFDKGEGVKQSYNEAIWYYQIGANRGDGDSLYRLALLHHTGKGMARNYIKAFELYTQSANEGNQDAQFSIQVKNEADWNRSLYKLDNSVDIGSLHYSDFLNMWEYLAEKKYTSLQYELGCLYEDLVDDSSLEIAFKWHSKAACDYHKGALYHLGRMFELGRGIGQNYLQAAGYYEQVGSLNSEALYRLGTLYQHGKGVKKDSKQAFECFKRSAEQRNARALFELGSIFEEGDIVQKNTLKAIQYYSMSASQGHVEAQQYLNNADNSSSDGELFYCRWYKLLSKIAEYQFNGNNNTKDDDHAYKHADSFLGRLNYILGYMHFNGYGTSVDYREAWRFFRNSSLSHGNENAADISTIKYRDIDSAEAANYLKKIEMFEEVVDQFSLEEIYELALIYYHGVYVVPKNSAANERYVIVKPNNIKSVCFFEMISNQRISRADQYYISISYYFGMIYYVDIERINDKSKAIYYLTNASNKGHLEARNLLETIGNDEKINSTVYESVLKWYFENQNSDHTKIIYNVGWMYYKGVGPEQDYDKAFYYFNIAADKQYADAQFQLGSFFEHGYSVEIDYTRAIEWYTKAANQNNLAAKVKLGLMYMKGIGVEKNYKLALGYFRQAAFKGDSKAQLQLGYSYFHGFGIRPSYIVSVEWYTKSASQDNVHALYNLGMMYYNGTGVERNSNIAIKYLMLAAEKGYSVAQAILGYFYRNGCGVEVDYSRAIEWSIKALSQNSSLAAWNLGDIYFLGQGGEQRYDLAIHYYKIAADKGDLPSQYQLGKMYYAGYGVKKDYTKAIEWLTMAAERNCARSLFKLGYIHFFGIGVKKSYRLAYQYFKVAADQGDADAQFELGFMYLNGMGVDKDIDLGIEYISKAANQLHDLALLWCKVSFIGFSVRVKNHRKTPLYDIGLLNISFSTYKNLYRHSRYYRLWCALQQKVQKHD